MQKINYDKNIVIFNQKKVEFQYDIMQLAIENENVFILLKIPFKNQELGYDEFHNVYCYNLKGNKIWQIGKRAKEIDDDIVFIMINIKDDKLYANDFLGRRFLVDKLNGNIDNSKIEITK